MVSKIPVSQDLQHIDFGSALAVSSAKGITTVSRRASTWSLGEANKTDLAMDFILTYVVISCRSTAMGLGPH